jgi:hypothetical protein
MYLWFKVSIYFDRILKMEDKETWEFLYKLFGMKIFHFNLSSKNYISPEWSRGDLDIVNSVFHKDFEAFDYEMR